MASSSSTSLAADNILRPFLAPSFDPADYLNATLPSWTPSTAQTPSTASVSLTELTSQTQTLVSQLNAQVNRLSNTLTQLTDDILRSAGRLTYEVEILQGDTSTLSDALTRDLVHDMQRFVPATPVPVAHESDAEDQDETDPETPSQRKSPEAEQRAPKYVTDLHTLTVVRSRLEAVIKVFDAAMSWPVAPSSMGTQSAFIPISTLASGTEGKESMEVQGQQFAQKVYNEILELVQGYEPGADAFKSALDRIATLRELAVVWKGTAEEKVRLKFVEGLAKIVEERHLRS